MTILWAVICASMMLIAPAMTSKMFGEGSFWNHRFPRERSGISSLLNLSRNSLKGPSSFWGSLGGFCFMA
ncbi:MAG: hypothetical protein BWY86_00616 [Candidatus Aminicenantes bacterium ADurb.Bin508]|nr:MAG: hypothetical protein BWY86_00616 [Candidatus Aminicenantes bacterium ADurb.Bin508]